MLTIKVVGKKRGGGREEIIAVNVTINQTLHCADALTLSPGMKNYTNFFDHGHICATYQHSSKV
jgi:hypothetical protein